MRFCTMRGPGREFARPWPLLALVVLVVNDHLGKGSGVLPAWLTGKLSDLAGLFFFPILLFAICRALGSAPRSSHERTRLASVCAGLTVLVFVALKAVTACNHAVNVALLALHQSPLVLDRSDLVACPMAWLAVLHQREPDAWRMPRLGRFLEPVCVLAAAIGSMATSPARPPPSQWNVPSHEDTSAPAPPGPRLVDARGGEGRRFVSRSNGCSIVAAQVAKETDQEVIVTVLNRSPADCPVQVRRAYVTIADKMINPSSLPAWGPQKTFDLHFSLAALQRATLGDAVNLRLSLEIGAGAGIEQHDVVYPLAASFHSR